jgi:hypothetical protein
MMISERKHLMDSAVGEYSFERITRADLQRLATLAHDYFDGLYKRSPDISGR